MEGKVGDVDPVLNSVWSGEHLQLKGCICMHPYSTSGSLLKATCVPLGFKHPGDGSLSRVAGSAWARLC